MTMHIFANIGKKVKKAMKQARFVHMPDILALTVKRFYYDMTGTISEKLGIHYK